ncbi:hypothetical protein ABPG74_019687 [Tetrahymena malaccensis]
MYQIKAEELQNCYNKIKQFHKQTIHEFLEYNKYVYVKDVLSYGFSLVVQAKSKIDQNIVSIEILNYEYLKKINHRKLEKCKQIQENFVDEKYFVNFIQTIEDLEYGNLAIVTQKYETNLAFILENNKFSMEQIHALTYQLLKGVLLLQEKGMVIKDIQPQNILYSCSKNQFLLTYHRFSKFIESSKKECQKRNLNYLSPQVLDKIKPYTTQDDIYSVGVVILEALIQRKIKGMEFIKLKSQPLFQVIPDLLNLKDQKFVNQVLCRMLDPDRNNRCQPLFLLQQLNKLNVDEKQLKLLNVDIAIQFKQEIQEEYQQIDETDSLFEAGPQIKIEESSQLIGQVKKYQCNQLQAQPLEVKSYKQANQKNQDEKLTPQLEKQNLVENTSSKSNTLKLNKFSQINKDDNKQNQIFQEKIQKNSESSMEPSTPENEIEIEKNEREIKINSIKDIDKAEKYELVNFDFRYDRIQKQGAQFLGLALQKCQKMTYLNLNFDGSYNLKVDRNCNFQDINKIDKINDEDIIHITQALKKCSNLTSLNINLSNNGVGSQGVQAIGNYLRQSENITFLSLNLSYNYLSDAASYLTQQLIKSQNLISLNLNLRNTKIKQGDIDIIAQSIGKLENLNFLDLNISQNFPTEKIVLDKLGINLQECKNLATLSINLDQTIVPRVEIQRFLDGVKNCGNLVSLSLFLQQIYQGQQLLSEFQKFATEFIQILCAGLLKAISISSLLLDLSCNTMSLDQIKLIADFINKCDNITSLNLQLKENWVDVEGLKYIGSSLEKSKNIKSLELNLQKNNLGQQGFSDFTNSLSKCVNYESLNITLSQSNIGTKESELLGQSISKLIKIKHFNLNLESNKLGQEGILSIALGLECCINITQLSLNLSKVNMKVSSVHVLAMCLKQCTKIYDLSLNLSRNKLSNQTAKSIGVLFSQCLKLKKACLHLEGNSFDNQGINDISAYFQDCQSLTYLNLSLNYQTSQTNSLKLNKLSVDNQISQIDKQNLEETLLKTCLKLNELIIV